VATNSILKHVTGKKRNNKGKDGFSKPTRKFSLIGSCRSMQDIRHESFEIFLLYSSKLSTWQRLDKLIAHN